jgi:hypothetical protein
VLIYQQNRVGLKVHAQFASSVLTGYGQGGQIGQIFAQLVTIYFGQLLKNYRRMPHTYLGYLIT